MLYKPLLDFIYLCRIFYKKISITNSYTSHVSNILVCEEFDIRKIKYLKILKYIYDNIDSSKYVHQILHLNHNFENIKKYDYIKYKTLVNYYDLLDKFYYLLKNENKNKNNYINKIIVPIQINNLIKWLNLIKKR